MGGSHWFGMVEDSDENDDDAGMPGASGGVPAAAANAAAAEATVHVSVTYRVFPNGVVECEWLVDAIDALPATLSTKLHKSLPRVGVAVPLPGLLDTVTWFGAGPHECYPDRKAGCLKGTG
eukprot:2863-Chlamydomonas_euryale.AAC.1